MLSRAEITGDVRSAPRASPPPLRIVLDNLEEIVATGILAVLLVIMVTSVTSRYVLESPLSWSNEISGLLMVWLVFLGSVGALKRAEHISVGVFVDSMPGALQTMIRWFGFLVIELVLLVLLIKGYELARETGRSALGLPISWAYVYAAAPTFAVLATIRLVQLIFSNYRFHFIEGSSNSDQDASKETSA